MTDLTLQTPDLRVPGALLGADALRRQRRAPGAAGPKQYQPVAGQPLVAHTLAAFAATAGLPACWWWWRRRHQLEQSGLADGCHVADCGGASRADSVAKGLRALQPGRRGGRLGAGARRRALPGHAGAGRALIDACQDDPVGGLLALPLADTLKRAAGARGRHAGPRATNGWRRRRRCSAWVRCSGRWRPAAARSPTRQRHRGPGPAPRLVAAGGATSR
jgi:2-C-methyl-D-erythritol 4-phosphate cytidylyltransferase